MPFVLAILLPAAGRGITRGATPGAVNTTAIRCGLALGFFGPRVLWTAAQALFTPPAPISLSKAHH